MDLSIIIGEWPYDEDEDANNVRKVRGIDGLPKVQLRIRSGVIQWAVEGRPDGEKPYGFPSVLDYCCDLLPRQARLQAAGRAAGSSLSPELAEELADEMLDYYRRGRALFLLGDYRRALGDALHNLRTLELIRRHCGHLADGLGCERYWASLLLDRSRAEMLLNLEIGDVRRALDALNRGIRDIERSHTEFEPAEAVGDCAERQILVDLRRSLREKYSVPLTDRELLESLKVEQEIAIRRENYEMAARLRDKMNSLRQKSHGRE
ncbi:MAG: UvrB/UvrC motif-containing protein [Planctomycetota bacterium]|jgi:tetratricopeptide (TPR) repeat protein